MMVMMMMMIMMMMMMMMMPQLAGRGRKSQIQQCTSGPPPG
jgi:hypothetical protein